MGHFIRKLCENIVGGGGQLFFFLLENPCQHLILFRMFNPYSNETFLTHGVPFLGVDQQTAQTLYRDFLSVLLCMIQWWLLYNFFDCQCQTHLHI